MKRVLLATLAAVALPTAGLAQTTIVSYDFESTPSFGINTKGAATATSDAVAGIYDTTAFTTTVVTTTGPNSIPSAPNSTTGTRKVLRFDANHKDANGAPDAVTFYPTTGSLSQYSMKFDAWLQYNGGPNPPNNGVGSSELFGVGGHADGTRAEWSQQATPNEGSSGFFFTMAGDGGFGQDYRYYEGSGPAGTALPNRIDAATYVAGPNWNGANERSGAPEGTATVWGSQIFTAALGYESVGAPGKQWSTWEMVVDGSLIRVYVTPKGGARFNPATWFVGNGRTSGFPFITYMDINTSIPPGDNFGLIDNLVIKTLPPATNAAKDWQIYQ